MSDPSSPADRWPASVDQVDAGWLGKVLSRSCGGPVEVSGFRSEQVGTGQVGECWRLELECASADAVDVPPSVILKVAASDPVSREAGRSQSCYVRETGFYRDIQDTVGIRTPRCHFCAIAEDETDHALVLEDLAPAEPGDQLTGCSVEQAAVALHELALLQAPRWGDPDLPEIAWLEAPGAEARAELAGLVTALHGTFLERYGDRIEAGTGEVVRWLAAHLGDLEDYRGPLTFVHNDYRVDNMLFGGTDAAPTVAVVDWQTLKLGSGPSDAAYFLGGSLPTQVRRQHERELLHDSYHATLLANGVGNLSFEQCWEEYRRGAFGGLLMAVIAAVLVGSTERGDEMFVTMARRHARHALDVDAAGAYGR